MTFFYFFFVASNVTPIITRIFCYLIIQLFILSYFSYIYFWCYFAGRRAGFFSL